MIKEKVLFVDDEPKLLKGIQRSLRDRYPISIAESGREGLQKIATNGPFAVVVSDFRMPQMHGIQFLTEVKRRSPDSIRMMLTGYADVETSIEAVNKGHVFRFLTKPCHEETLAGAIDAGLEQYRLVHAERELLEKTFSGSIKVLTEILSLTNPMAFSRATRIQEFVKHIVDELELPDRWQYQIAALLSHIGCVTIPPDILEKRFENEVLTKKEYMAFKKHPEVGARLLKRIPRMEVIAGMIAGQNEIYDHRKRMNMNPTGEEAIELGAQILRVCIELDSKLMDKKTMKQALAELHKETMGVNPELVEILTSYESESEHDRVVSIYLKEMKAGMMLEEHIHGKSNGMLLATKGQEITQVMIDRLHAFSKTIGVDEPFYVRL